MLPVDDDDDDDDGDDDEVMMLCNAQCALVRGVLGTLWGSNNPPRVPRSCPRLAVKSTQNLTSYTLGQAQWEWRRRLAEKEMSRVADVKILRCPCTASYKTRPMHCIHTSCILSWDVTWCMLQCGGLHTDKRNMSTGSSLTLQRESVWSASQTLLDGINPKCQIVFL